MYPTSSTTIRGTKLRRRSWKQPMDRLQRAERPTVERREMRIISREEIGKVLAVTWRTRFGALLDGNGVETARGNQPQDAEDDEDRLSPAGDEVLVLLHVAIRGAPHCLERTLA